MAKQFRSLENNSAETRKDDILRAAISAFIGLTQPSKRDCIQIEDLALSILPFTSDSTRRFVAAAFSEKQVAPHALVRRLCEETADICAPLLLSSPVLTPVDLVTIIGRMGKTHARVIARRAHLPNAVIEALALLDDPVAKERVSGGLRTGVSDPMHDLANVKPISAEAARQMLREIMAATPQQGDHIQTPESQGGPTFLPREAAKRLIGLALHEQEGLLVTALADMAGLPFARMQKLLRRQSPSELSTVLKAFELDGPTAFVICSVFYPQIAGSRSETHLFLKRHDAMDCASALSMIRNWKAEEITQAVRRNGANSAAVQDGTDHLKAS